MHITLHDRTAVSVHDCRQAGRLLHRAAGARSRLSLSPSDFTHYHVSHGNWERVVCVVIRRREYSRPELLLLLTGRQASGRQGFAAPRAATRPLATSSIPI